MNGTTTRASVAKPMLALSVDYAYAATGEDFADALSAAAAAGHKRGVLYLAFDSEEGMLPAGVLNQPGLFETDPFWSTSTKYMVGGPQSIPESTMIRFMERAGIDLCG